MGQYLVKTRLRVDGRLYEPGRQVHLADAQAAPLLAMGAVILAPVPPAVPMFPVVEPFVPVQAEAKIEPAHPVGAAESPDYAAMTVDQLKAALSAQGVAYDSGARKAELLALLLPPADAGGN